MSEGGMPEVTRRDRASLRAGARGRRRGASVGAAIASVIWEVVGEILFFVLVALVSWLVYEELRWSFIAVVFLGVNVVLALIALAVWGSRRRARRR